MRIDQRPPWKFLSWEGANGLAVLAEFLLAGFAAVRMFFPDVSPFVRVAASKVMTRMRPIEAIKPTMVRSPGSAIGWDAHGR